MEKILQHLQTTRQLKVDQQHRNQFLYTAEIPMDQPHDGFQKILRMGKQINRRLCHMEHSWKYMTCSFIDGIIIVRNGVCC